MSHPNKRKLIYLSANATPNVVQDVLAAGFTACRGGKDYDSSMEVLMRSDALFVAAGWAESTVVVSEIERAQKWGMPVFYDLELLKEWAVDKPCPEML